MKRILTAVWLAAPLIVSQPAAAHVTVFTDPDKPVELPNIVSAWAVNGFLFRPGQVDTITFTGKKDELFIGAMLIPNKAGAREFAPNFALIGPGLPAASANVPFSVPQGSGALVFTTPTEREFLDEQFGYGPLLGDTFHEIALPADGRYTVAIYHPEGKLGHYIMSVGESEDETLIPNVQQYTIPTFGDVNGDEIVDENDTRLLLAAIVGKATLSARQRFAADVGPVGDFWNLVNPGNGIIDAGDASRLLRRALGLDAERLWPF